MMKSPFQKIILITMLLPAAVVMAEEKNSGISSSLEVYQLAYIEREPGQDDYEVSMLVSDRYLRVDEPGEENGYILYDDLDKIIYSVSHYDESVLVIKQQLFSVSDSPVRPMVEYLQLADAPSVAGNDVYNYRVYVDDGKAGADSEQTCTEIQLVENLLPEVRKLLQNYQKVVSGQQVKMVDNEITEIQNACFYADQVYNTGAYYEKGMPIQEWHSNERSKILTSYKNVSVDHKKFTIPAAYRQFSVDSGSRKPLE